ncbi:MAG: penicillin-binding protein activator LpoB [Leptospirales bacterium]
MPFMRRAPSFLSVIFTIALVVLGGCSSYSVKRVSLDTEGGVTSRWTDTDARLTADTLIRKAMDSTWMTEFHQKHGRVPVVALGQIINRSDQHINTRIFLNHFQDDLINSGKVIFVTGSSAHREAASAEREYQMRNARSSTIHAPGQQTGADFLLTGSINSYVASRGGKTVRFYETHLKAINLNSNEIIWGAEYRVKKIAHQSGYGF